MDTDRRSFLRAAAGAAALWLGRRGAAAEAPPLAAAAEAALGVHRATRNTFRGAVGDRLRAFRPARRPFKPWPDRARQPLPAPRFETGRALFDALGRGAPARAFARAALPLDALSRLLFLTNGVTSRGGDTALRAAPSAGALYSGELYALVERVEGLAPGVYSYLAADHALVSVREGPPLTALASALETPGAFDGAAVVFAISHVFGRYSIRYANRGYRYALIDTGHLDENLRLAAWELGLESDAAERFEDDRVNALLGIDGREEAVCALRAVARGAEARVRRPQTRRALRERGVAEASQAGRSAPARFHEATKLVAANGASPAVAETAAAAQSPRAREPRPGAPDTAVHTAVRTRRSARRFESASLPRAALDRVLTLARGEPALWRGDALDLYCVAHRVEDTPPGLYRFRPARSQLEPLREEKLASALVEACLGQSKSGEAAAALIGVARLADATVRGARGYRDVLVDAGATAQRVYLAAEAQGFAARNLAAYYDDELDALLGLDARTEVAVHLTALGLGD